MLPLPRKMPQPIYGMLGGGARLRGMGRARLNQGPTPRFTGGASILIGYTADISLLGTAISSGDDSGFPASNAYDDNSANEWRSSDSPAVSGTTYVGIDFGSGASNRKRIRRFTIRNGRNGVAGWGSTSVKVQYSADLASWLTADTISLLDDQAATVQTKDVSDVGKWRAWRLLDNVGVATRMTVAEIEWLEGVYR